MQSLNDDLFASGGCSQASTQEVSQNFVSQEITWPEEQISDNPKVKILKYNRYTLITIK